MHFTRARIQLLLQSLQNRVNHGGRSPRPWIQGDDDDDDASSLASAPASAPLSFMDGLEEDEPGTGAALVSGAAGEDEDVDEEKDEDGDDVSSDRGGGHAEGMRAEDTRTWSRARLWKFHQLLRNFHWRVGQRSAGRWVVAPHSEDSEPKSVSQALARTFHRPQAVPEPAAPGAPGSNVKGVLPQPQPQPQGKGTVDVLEMLLPDPSADGRGMRSPRRGAAHGPEPEPELVWLEVIAQEDVDAVLHSLYVDPAAGASRGARALYERSLLQYVGIHMSTVAAFLARQETKQAVHPKLGHLVEQPSVPTAPNAEWEVDLAQVLLPTRTLHRYICSVIDVFSRFAWVVPLDTNDGDKVAAALQTLFLSEGAPEKLRSDGGGDVDNAAVSALCARFRVHRSLCRSHNSECNGMVERLHRTVKESLVRQTSEWSSAAHTVDWVALLPSLLHAYNTSVHTVTKYSPFFLFRGRKPRARRAAAAETVGICERGGC